ncbi:hypothetical protein DYB32_006952 [Aphanomyces invadans]|uniref:Uncharacterized protein n=1 Tax=Aphanomyces invadans TaxID=157072 RepID=A0A418APZ9_9STRA|nr:hypothetical protein DYB32_006952 [Aphanomyces invadans]
METSTIVRRVQIVPLGDTSCRLTFVVQVDLGQSFHTSDIDDIELAAMMKKLTIFPDAGKTPPIFPCLPSYVTDYDGSEVTSVALRNIIETGKSTMDAATSAADAALHDLELVIAHDAGLQCSLDRVYDLLLEDDDDDVEEACSLILAAQPGQTQSFWERAAKRERIELIKATQEKEQLEEALQQQATFVDQMQRVFRKKPRVEVLWIFCLVAMDGTDATTLNHTTAIHAIADRQYRRMASAFLRAGLLDHEEDKFEVKLLPQPKGQSMVFQLVHHVLLAVPFHDMGASLWKGIGKYHLPYSSDDGASVEELEEVDADTVYGRYSTTLDGHTSWHSNLIRKHYVERDRHVYIARTVLDDELSGPRAPNAVVESKCVWATLARVTSESSRLTILLHMDVDMDIDAANELQTLLSNMPLPQPHNDKRRLDLSPLMQRIDPSVFPFSNMKVFFEGSKRIQAAINTIINSAIESYKVTSAQA